MATQESVDIDSAFESLEATESATLSSLTQAAAPVGKLLSKLSPVLALGYITALSARQELAALLSEFVKYAVDEAVSGSRTWR